MPQNSWRIAKQALESRRVEIAARVRDIRDRLEIDATGDEIERLMSRMEREVAVTQAEELTAQLREVEDALQRIEEGTFGECVKCARRIRPARLEVMPWAALCVSCQEAEENLEGEESTGGQEPAPAN